MQQFLSIFFFRKFPISTLEIFSEKCSNRAMSQLWHTIQPLNTLIITERSIYKIIFKYPHFHQYLWMISGLYTHVTGRWAILCINFSSDANFIQRKLLCNLGLPIHPLYFAFVFCDFLRNPKSYQREIFYRYKMGIMGIIVFAVGEINYIVTHRLINTVAVCHFACPVDRTAGFNKEVTMKRNT